MIDISDYTVSNAAIFQVLGVIFVVVLIQGIIAVIRDKSKAKATPRQQKTLSITAWVLLASTVVYCGVSGSLGMTQKKDFNERVNSELAEIGGFDSVGNSSGLSPGPYWSPREVAKRLHSGMENTEALANIVRVDGREYPVTVLYTLNNEGLLDVALLEDGEVFPFAAESLPEMGIPSTGRY